MNNRVHAELNGRATVIDEGGKKTGVKVWCLMYSNGKIRDKLSCRLSESVYMPIYSISFLCYLISI